MIFVFITCKNKKEAEKIGLVLLKKKLAACFLVIPDVSSSYRWLGKIKKTSEAILIIKTLSQKFSQIEGEVKKLHSYKIPIVAQISVKVNKEYLKWLKTEVK